MQAVRRKGDQQVTRHGFGCGLQPQAFCPNSVTGGEDADEMIFLHNRKAAAFVCGHLLQHVNALKTQVVAVEVGGNRGLQRSGNLVTVR